MISKIKKSFISWLGIPNQDIINQETKTIMIPEGYTVLFQGNLHIQTTGHLILESGKTVDENGLMRGIWLNPDFDHNGNLVCLDTEIIDEGGEHDHQHRRIE